MIFSGIQIYEAISGRDNQSNDLKEIIGAINELNKEVKLLKLYQFQLETEPSDSYDDTCTIRRIVKELRDSKESESGSLSE